MESDVLRVFEHSDFGRVRVVMIDGVPWFVGRDAARALGYKNPNSAVSSHVDAEDRMRGHPVSESTRVLHTPAREGVRISHTPDCEGVRVSHTPADTGYAFCDPVSGSGTQYPVLINESGLYSLILSSQLPAAKKFKRWVTAEVLPAIRQTGSFVPEVPKAEQLPAPVPAVIPVPADAWQNLMQRVESLEHKTTESSLGPVTGRVPIVDQAKTMWTQAVLWVLDRATAGEAKDIYDYAVRRVK